MSKNSTVYQGMALSRFCLQVSILLKSAAPLSDGLEAMASSRFLSPSEPASSAMASSPSLKGTADLRRMEICRQKRERAMP